ncbi:hypothetical protein CSC80_04875 [Maribacter sp. 6B07]|nr:hypothetical protein CSC80_04875 [Maribacter sp. 6B07]
MRKLMNLFLFIVSTIIISGLYGIIHNQVTFTISSEYFTHFKFIQHHLPEYFIKPARLGASVIGWNSTWWVGLIFGFILGSLWIRNDTLTIKDRFKAFSTICITTITVGTIGYLIAHLQWQPTKHYEVINFPNYGGIIDESIQSMTNPYAFLRAGTVHNFSYIGGILGLLLSIFQLWKHLRNEI